MLMEIGSVCAMIFSSTSSFAGWVLDLHPNLSDEIVPVGFISATTILTWLVIAVVFRVLHRSQGPALLVCGTKLWGRVAYRTSFLAALERPVMVLITIFALLMIVFRVEPALIKSRYTGPSWVGAYFVSVIWFLERWKRNVLARALEMRSISVAERENLVTFNKASAIFLFFKGLVMLADSFKLVVPLWFAVVSMTMTIAILGLVVLYYRNCPRISVMPSAGNGLNLGPSIAAKDVVRNVISGTKLLMLQQRFEVGNMIRVDDVDGQVVSSGLATTCILMADTARITVPNSVLLDLLYLNRVTRQHPPIDRWDAMVTNIPLRTFDINTIDLTSVEIERMLESSPKVLLEEPPFCFFSRTERSVNLTVGCSLREMSQTEFKSTKKEFLIQSIEIITQHGATLACTLEDVLSL